MKETKIAIEEQRRRERIGKALEKKPVKNISIVSESLAYIIGTLKGDGFLTKNKVRLEVNDKDFIEEFEKNILNWSGLKCKIYTKNITTNYQLYLYSTPVAKYLSKFDYHILYNYPSIYFMFLRGFYDSEGSVSVKAKGIFVFNNDEHLLSFCKELLSKLNIKTTPIRVCGKIGEEVMFKDRSYIRKNNTHQLSIYGKENIKRFKEIISFGINRKNVQVNKLLSSYKK